jgi:hypothetical protein
VLLKKEITRGGQLMTSATNTDSKEYLEKESSWDYSIGLATIDGGKPSDFLMELIEKEKRGEITIQDIREELGRKYKAS